MLGRLQRNQLTDQSDLKTPGWDALDAALKSIYGDVEPIHWAAVPHYRLGGNDPLDGISAYKNSGPPQHWHFITYGFSELYAKESELAGLSGYGFELTFRLARNPDETNPPSWVFGFLQNIARYVFKTGNLLDVGHHMDLNGPIALGQSTQIGAIFVAQDPQLPPIETVNGRLRFLEVVGVTQDELAASQAWKTDGMIELIAQSNSFLVTDLWRESILRDNAIAETASRRGREEGSSTATQFGSMVEWQLPTPQNDRMKITLGAKIIASFKLILPNRLGHDKPLTVLSHEKQVQFIASSEQGWKPDGATMQVRLTPQAAVEIADLVQPKRGTYRPLAAPGLEIEVVPSPIKDNAGNLIEIIG
jgi:hypothetical protein